MGAFLVVFAGAGLGGMARHAINLAVGRLGLAFPIGTVAVNVAGSYAMGVLAAWFVLRTGQPQGLRLFLTTGMLGGFTTFSAFSLDAALMIERSDWGAAALYVAASVVLAVAGLFAGMATVRFLA